MNLLPHPLAHAVEQGGTSAENNVLEEVFSDVDVALLNRRVAVLVHSIEVVESRLFWREQDLGGSEPLAAY